MSLSTMPVVTDNKNETLRQTDKIYSVISFILSLIQQYHQIALKKETPICFL